MPRIERVAENVAALVQPVRLAQLLGTALDVVALVAQRSELIGFRERLASGIDRRAMVDHSGNDNEPELQT